MDEVWNGLLTCDYEHSRPHATALEWDLYTCSLITWPAVMMDDESPYGRLRRPGIVDVPEAEHLRLTAAWHTQLTSALQAEGSIRRAVADQRSAAVALNDLEQALAAPADVAAAAAANATRVMLRVMSAHIVNWLLPEARWETLLTRLFGSREAALECLSALMTPTETGHVLDTHAHLLIAASALATPPQPGAASPTAPLGRSGAADRIAAELAATTGYLYGATPAIDVPDHEDAAYAARLLRSTAITTDPDTDLATITSAGRRAREQRDAWYIAAILAAAGDTSAVDEVRAMAMVLSWAADSEERRKELRHRYLALVRRWCTRSAIDPARITTSDILAENQ